MIRELIKANFSDVYFNNNNLDFLNEEQLINYKNLYNRRNFSAINSYIYKKSSNTFILDTHKQFVLVRFTNYHLADSDIFNKHYSANMISQSYFLNYTINQFTISFCYLSNYNIVRVTVYDSLNETINCKRIIYVNQFTREKQLTIATKINTDTHIGMKKINDWLTFCFSHLFLNKLL